MTRSLAWDGDAVVAVDQCALPHEYRMMRLDSVDAVIDAIVRLAIRGAPAIGVAGALAVAISAARHTRGGVCDEVAVRADARRIAEARPTAVNLAWAVRRVAERIPAGPEAVLAEALAILAEDERLNRAAAEHAADLVLDLCGRRPLRLLTHCNTGRLATVAWGTALGAIRVLAEGGHVAEVLFGETRPLLQGARLTAWELAEAGIPHRMCVDSAGPTALAAGLVDCVLVGADRVCANGDVANKVGTYPLALAAARAGVPFVVVAPESTVDLSVPSGASVVIEQRSAAEVTTLAGAPIAPAGTDAYNPAFDITPGDLVTAVVTENGVQVGLKEAS
ncbi:S-methyl-5-thioribose-1-phosphate isomerase [Actinokineospora soli]|uniref:Methylthioribose-1-phosphate isomerase n=1 Tax=Actinokineospora soli TaxID=1048753 RepID=A0ABW2TJF7_9PSEU